MKNIHIIPHEEPKPECICGICDYCEEQETTQILKEAKENALTQERLEEAAANLADPNLCKTDNWIAGAKWQADRMYSEEDMYNAYDKGFKNASKKMYSEEEVEKIARDAYEMGRKNVLIGVFNKWFKQFKKRQHDKRNITNNNYSLMVNSDRTKRNT